jgi:hypothetical protein
MGQTRELAGLSKKKGTERKQLDTNTKKKLFFGKLKLSIIESILGMKNFLVYYITL